MTLYYIILILYQLWKQIFFEPVVAKCNMAGGNNIGYRLTKLLFQTTVCVDETAGQEL